MAQLLDEEQVAALLEIDDPEVRLKEVGSATLSLFLDQLSQRTLADMAKKLPRIPGFNRGTDGERQRQRKQIINVASSGSVNGATTYWDAYRFCWSLIMSRTFADQWTYSVNDKRLTEPDAAYSVVKSLTAVAADSEYAVSREVIAELLILSTLELNADVRLIVSEVPDKASMERENQVKSLTRRVEAIENSLRELREPPGLTEDLTAANANLERLETTFRSSMDALRSELVESIEIARVSTMRSSSESTASGFQDISDRVDNLEHELSLSNISEVKALQELIDVLSEETAELRAGISKTGDQKSSKQSTDGSDDSKEARDSGLSARPRYTLLTREAEGLIEIASWNDAFAALSIKFADLGLTVGDSVILAISIIGALRVGQIPVFGGSIASVLAIEISRDFLGSPALSIDIPFGCRDAIDLDAVKNHGPKALAILGLSRAPFDSIGCAVRNDVHRSQLGWEQTKLCPALGEFEDGTAALPLSASVLELGPFIELDTLTWAQKPNRDEVAPTFLSPALLADRHVTGDNDQTIYIALMEELRSAAIVTSAAWRSATQRFWNALVTTNAENANKIQSEQIIDAMYRFWITPMLCVFEHEISVREKRLSAFAGPISKKARALLQAPSLNVR